MVLLTDGDDTVVLGPAGCSASTRDQSGGDSGRHSALVVPAGLPAIRHRWTVVPVAHSHCAVTSTGVPSGQVCWWRTRVTGRRRRQGV
ncbi:hypothetical protein [Streptoalloteichus hindustanus]|uniref:hypothetical protein n=1 Tax=Streptoalloteichus hindustanus TaxID=2017 RepID=UPI001160F022|nr:hypothetical protein [Streptoalloteichus hindustanus]